MYVLEPIEIAGSKTQLLTMSLSHKLKSQRREEKRREEKRRESEREEKTPTYPPTPTPTIFIVLKSGQVGGD